MELHESIDQIVSGLAKKFKISKEDTVNRMLVFSCAVLLAKSETGEVMEFSLHEVFNDLSLVQLHDWIHIQYKRIFQEARDYGILKAQSMQKKKVDRNFLTNGEGAPLTWE